MNAFYLRAKPKWINFIQDDIEGFLEMYSLHPQPIVVGDLALMSSVQITKLLKMLEDYPEISCFSSRDVDNSILYSRFQQFIIEPVKPLTPLEGSVQYHDLLNVSDASKALLAHIRRSHSIREMLL